MLEITVGHWTRESEYLVGYVNAVESSYDTENIKVNFNKSITLC